MEYKKVSGGYRFSELTMRINISHLYVNDIEGADSFYSTLSSILTTSYHNPQTVSLSYFFFDKAARLEIMNKPNMSDLPAINRTDTLILHICIRWKLRYLTAELKADGYEVISGPEQPDGY